MDLRKSVCRASLMHSCCKRQQECSARRGAHSQIFGGGARHSHRGAPCTSDHPCLLCLSLQPQPDLCHFARADSLAARMSCSIQDAARAWFSMKIAPSTSSPHCLQVASRHNRSAPSASRLAASTQKQELAEVRRPIDCPQRTSPRAACVAYPLCSANEVNLATQAVAHLDGEEDAFAELVTLAVSKDPSLAAQSAKTGQKRRKAASSVAGKSRRSLLSY